jgi:hypothetical protein
MTQLFINSSAGKIATILSWLYVPEHYGSCGISVSQSPAHWLSLRWTAKFRIPVFGIRLAGLCEGMTANYPLCAVFALQNVVIN